MHNGRTETIVAYAYEPLYPEESNTAELSKQHLCDTFKVHGDLALLNINHVTYVDCAIVLTA
jgi:hypothetical protein